MTFTAITSNTTPICAPDMHGKPCPAFTPFAVRGPKFIELADGTLLYYFQAKYHSDGDEAPHCMVQMRSRDGGVTWGEPVLMRYDGEPFEEPCCFVPLYDEVHDTILAMRSTRHWKPGYERDRIINESDQIYGYTLERFWVAKSTDGGFTWTDYREVFIDGMPAHWNEQHILTPSIGIQLHHQKDLSKNGRLAIAAYHCGGYEGGRNEFGAHILISDDFGDSWRVGATALIPGSNEGMLAELADGTLLINCRNMGNPVTNRRIQGVSRDGGETLSEDCIIDTLYDPCCHGGFASAVIDGQEYLFFTSPTGEIGTEYHWDGGIDGFWGKRVALMLYVSTDGGKTYRAIRQLCGRDELAAYSSLLVTSGGKLLCGWESGPLTELYRDIKYAAFELTELAELCK